MDPQRGDLGVERPQRRGGGLLLVVERRELDLDDRAGEAEGAPAERGRAASAQSRGGGSAVRKDLPTGLSLHSLAGPARAPSALSSADTTLRAGNWRQEQPRTSDVISSGGPAGRALRPLSIGGLAAPSALAGRLGRVGAVVLTTEPT